MGYCGLFVGLTTLDLIYGVAQLPQPNRKQTATEMAISAGGPATNAAIAFRHLGNRAIVLSALGVHPLADLVRADLATQGVECIDLAPHRTAPPPLSTVMVTPSNGDRAVVSRNALDLQVDARLPSDLDLASVDIVLADGHQLGASLAVAQKVRTNGVPIVLDGGSWKPHLDTLLPLIDYAICSADFFPPGCHTPMEVIQYLQQAITQPQIAITQGGEPIFYHDQGTSGLLNVPQIQPVDTLGAGDAFHGAFCHWILHTPFVAALEQSTAIAALACQSFGTRQWLQMLSAR